MTLPGEVVNCRENDFLRDFSTIAKSSWCEFNKQPIRKDQP